MYKDGHPVQIGDRTTHVLCPGGEYEVVVSLPVANRVETVCEPLYYLYIRGEVKARDLRKSNRNFAGSFVKVHLDVRNLTLVSRTDADC